jgi:hypothetical protein
MRSAYNGNMSLLRPVERIRILTSIALLAPALVASPSWASSIFVAPATGSGVYPDDLATATELVQASIPEVSSNEVVKQASDADFVLQPRLIRLGQAYVMTLSKMKNGETIYSTKLKAEKIDELDRVAKRLTRSVLESKSAGSQQLVGEITDEEAHQGTQRRPVRQAFYLGFGGASLHNLNTTGLGYSAGAAYTWDLNTLRLKLFGEGDVNGAAFFVDGGIGGNYYLSREDVAPYLSADFGGGAAKVDQGLLDGQTIGGFVFGVGTGVELLRTSSVNLDLGFRAAFLLHNNQLGSPEALSLRLGIYF